jgi:hypothetical protein
MISLPGSTLRISAGHADVGAGGAVEGCDDLYGAQDAFDGDGYWEAAEFACFSSGRLRLGSEEVLLQLRYELLEVPAGVGPLGILDAAHDHSERVAAGIGVAADRGTDVIDELSALPVLRAATDPDACGGDCYEPGRLGEGRGPPRRVGYAKTAHDEQLAGHLWQASETLTGVTFPTLQRPAQPPSWPAGPRGRVSGRG